MERKGYREGGGWGQGEERMDRGREGDRQREDRREIMRVEGVERGEGRKGIDG